MLKKRKVSKETKMKIRETVKKYYKEPKNREKTSKATKIGMNRPEVKTKLRKQKSKEHKARLKEVQNNPIIKAKIKAAKMRNGTNQGSFRMRTKMSEIMVNPKMQARILVAKEQNKTTAKSPKVRAKEIVTKTRNGTLPGAPEVTEKMLATQKRNGTTGKSPKIIAKKIATMMKNGTISGNPNKFANAFFKYFDSQVDIKGRYGQGEIWVRDSIGILPNNQKYVRPDYFNKKLKLIIEWNEPPHYKRNGELREFDDLKNKVIKNRYPEFLLILIKETDYFSKHRYLKDINKNDYRIFDKIIKDIFLQYEKFEESRIKETSFKQTELQLQYT